ncbi:adenylosuccinate synthetase [Candidatus Beckwithbacteria bacterium]|nr:adenylosuccinate synthetase [Candidatus Beckwithbacteria bacterium]
MSDFLNIYRQVYKQNKYVKKLPKQTSNLFLKNRPNSIAIGGGAIGDEGKGRIVDELVANFLKKHKEVVVYRDNGGANAGHTVEVGNVRIALHQLGSGILQKGCHIMLGKEMVLHPEDLITEIELVKKATNSKNLPARLSIDEMAFLCLDTHRAFDAVLKQRADGYLGATGRGISPAYADVIFRHALRIRDLMARNWKDKLTNHFKLYQEWIKGMNFDLAKIEVPRLTGEAVKVGSLKIFLNRLEKTRNQIKPFATSVYDLIKNRWENKTPIIFEKAQALGLDKRWGVYPDVTVSNCGLDGILSSTDGVVDPNQIAIKTATIKTTYTSSVGSRVLPTLIKTKLAAKIREDANEYGATTKRPRDIAYIDLPMLSFLFRVGGIEYVNMTHLDICYQNIPIKVCIAYKQNGKEVAYRPDQSYLDTVKPEYLELPSWDGKTVSQVRCYDDLPKETKQYISFLSACLQAKPFMLTVGPKREQTIKCY